MLYICCVNKKFKKNFLNHIVSIILPPHNALGIVEHTRIVPSK